MDEVPRTHKTLLPPTVPNIPLEVTKAQRLMASIHLFPPSSKYSEILYLMCQYRIYFVWILIIIEVVRKRDTRSVPSIESKI